MLDSLPYNFPVVRMNNLENVLTGELLWLLRAQQSHAEGIDENDSTFAMNIQRVGECLHELPKSLFSFRKLLVDGYQLAGSFENPALQFLVVPLEFDSRASVHRRCHHGSREHD